MFDFPLDVAVGRAIVDGRYDEALRLLSLQEADDPTSPVVHTLKAQVHAFSGDTNAAEASAHRALALDENDFTAHQFLGMLYYRSGRNRQALTHTRKALQVYRPELDGPHLPAPLRKLTDWLRKPAVPSPVRDWAECVGGSEEDLKTWLKWAEYYIAEQRGSSDATMTRTSTSTLEDAVDSTRSRMPPTGPGRPSRTAAQQDDED